MGRKFKPYGIVNFANLRVDMPRTEVHFHNYGNVSQYFRALAKKKLIGTYCSMCRKTFLPPRPDCPMCWKKTNWVILRKKGRVATFAKVAYSGAGFEEDLAMVGTELPCVIVYVKIDGVDTSIMSRLEKCDPEEVKVGMKVEARFVKIPNFNCLDLYWVPA